MKPLRFLLSLITEDNDYQLEQASAAQTTAKQLGIELRTIFAGNDAITQSTQILKVLQSDPTLRPNAVIVEPAGGTSMPQVARAAVGAGVGWAILNREAEYTGDLRKGSRIPVFSVSSDQREIGRIQGRQIATLLPRGGAVLYIQGPSENVVAKGRATGTLESLPHNIQVTNLKGRWTEESAYNSVVSWLRLMTSQRVQIDLIAAQNDVMAMGARKAFQELLNESDRDVWLKMPYLGCDGVPKTGQAWVRTGSLTATIVIPPSASQALALMAQALRDGAQLPEHSPTVPQPFPPIEKMTPH